LQKAYANPELIEKFKQQGMVVNGGLWLNSVLQ
jgi:hypothetical protein